MKTARTIAPILMSILAATWVAGCKGGSKNAPAPAAPQADPQAELNQAIEAANKTPSFDSFNNLGMVHLKRGEAEKAAQAFERVVAINAKSPVAHNNLCASYASYKQWRKAIKACEAALAIEPGMQLAKNNLNWAKGALAETEKRIAELKTKAGARPSPDQLMQIGLEYYGMGDLEPALATWQRVPAGSKNWALVQNNIASAAIPLGRFAVARKAIEAALAAEPNNGLYQNNRRWLDQAEKQTKAPQQ